MNSKTQSLNEQIIAVMNSGNFIAPPALKKAEAKSENPRSLIFELLSGRGTGMEELMNEHMVAVASLSDYGKAIYTLHEQKNALLKEKAGKLQENMTSNEPEVSSHEFGGFGIMLSISMGGGRRNLIDFVTKDHQADDQLEYEVRILQQECQILDEMKTMEMMGALSTTHLCHSHRMRLNENFEVMVCSCGAEYEKDHTEKFASAMRKLAERYDITLIANDHAIIGPYADLVKELEEANVVCKTGFIPGLATDTTKAIFVPKDLSAEGMYEDVHLESHGKAGTTATDRKGRVQELFDQIRAAGEAYVPQAKEEPANAEA